MCFGTLRLPQRMPLILHYDHNMFPEHCKHFKYDNEISNFEAHIMTLALKTIKNKPKATEHFETKLFVYKISTTTDSLSLTLHHFQLFYLLLFFC